MVSKRRNLHPTVTNGAKHSAAPGKAGFRSAVRPVHGNIQEFRWVIGWWAAVIFLVLVICILHNDYLLKLFEGDKHFSHLSNMEREMAFRTEMGLYYSYFKTIIWAPSFGDGLYQITNDNVTEYPNNINTLKRFNLYPEVVLGYLFRFYNDTATAHNWRTKSCWLINRGDGQSSVNSCDGFGEPTYFYVHAVMFLNGLMMSFYFLLGTTLSESILGGLVAVACYMFNHGESTRVMWTPPLRESFAYPFQVLEMLILVYILKKPKVTYRRDSLLLAACVVSFMLPWQFAQFSLLTQLVAVFGCYALRYINLHRMKVILLGHTIGLLVSFVMLFGNEMLLTSFFAAAIVTVSVILLLHRPLNKLHPLLTLVVQGAILLTGMVGIKYLLGKLLQVEDDAHIADILRSKFSNFKTFHTMLYTCAEEFDFLPAQYFIKLCKTLLLPTVIYLAIHAVIQLLHREWSNWKSGSDEGVIYPEPEEDENTEELEPEKEGSEVVYILLQTCAFCLMAVIIMRLKLFFTPAMCVVASLVASRKFFGRLIPNINYHRAGVVVLVALMAVQGLPNVNEQLARQGEYQNYPMEQMFDWVLANTKPTDVFAGPMPTMANLKLSTLRPIVNHPHYEDVNIRERTQKVYTLVSRKEVSEVHPIIKSLGVNYIVYEGGWCLRSGAKPGCSSPEIWDLVDPVNVGKPPLCVKIMQKSEPYFRRVYHNSKFDVFKVL